MAKPHSRDQYLPDAAKNHEGTPHPPPDGINPQNPDSMPRGEDDDATKKTSPEFNDLPGAPWVPGRRG